MRDYIVIMQTSSLDYYNIGKNAWCKDANFAKTFTKRGAEKETEKYNSYNYDANIQFTYREI